MQLARPIIRRLYRETFRFGGCARARARAPYPFTGRFDRRAISRSVRGAKVPMLSKFAPFPCWSIRPVPCPPSPPSRRTGDSESRRNFARASSLLALVGGMGYFSSFFFLLSPSPPPPSSFRSTRIISMREGRSGRRSWTNNHRAFHATSRSRGVTAGIHWYPGAAAPAFIFVGTRASGPLSGHAQRVPGRDRARARRDRYEPEAP